MNKKSTSKTRPVVARKVEPVVVRLGPSVTLIHGDCRDAWAEVAKAPAAILDPPFDKWADAPWFPNATTVCFTNWQNRGDVEKKYGTPRCELIWHFKDGRWVSHAMPRITHENILVYGKTGDCYVGDYNENREPIKKGRGCIGRDKLGERTYVPRERKALNSVMEFPRNVAGEMGCWGKPVELMERIVEWLAVDFIADPFMGSASAGVACVRKGVKYLGIERDEQTFETARKRMEAELMQGVFDFGGGAVAPTHNPSRQPPAPGRG